MPVARVEDQRSAWIPKSIQQAVRFAARVPMGNHFHPLIRPFSCASFQRRAAPKGAKKQGEPLPPALCMLSVAVDNGKNYPQADQEHGHQQRCDVRLQIAQESWRHIYKWSGVKWEDQSLLHMRSLVCHFEH